MNDPDDMWSRSAASALEWEHEEQDFQTAWLALHGA